MAGWGAGSSVPGRPGLVWQAGWQARLAHCEAGECRPRLLCRALQPRDHSQLCGTAAVCATTSHAATVRTEGARVSSLPCTTTLTQVLSLPTSQPPVNITQHTKLHILITREADTVHFLISFQVFRVLSILCSQALLFALNFHCSWSPLLTCYLGSGPKIRVNFCIFFSGSARPCFIIEFLIFHYSKNI